MESVNELLKLFMQQARRERVVAAFDATAHEVPATQLEQAQRIRFSNGTAQVHDHD